jgi:uncharacterized protein
MTKERLQALSLEELQEIAGREEISFFPNVNRETLIELIMEEEEEEKSDREHSNNAAMRVKEKKFDITKDEAESDLTEFELPESYNETKITLLLRDPLWAFAFWDLKQSDVETIENLIEAQLLLRVYQVDDSEKGTGERTEPFEIPVKLSDRRWYINLPKSGLKYSLEIIAQNGEDQWVLCESNSVESPTVSANSVEGSSVNASFRTALAVSGLQDSDDFSQESGISQRIISLEDTQYLHLQG